MNVRRHVPVFKREGDPSDDTSPLPDASDMTAATATARDNPATSIKGAALGRSDLFRLAPDHLVVVTDKAHPLYDERVFIPLNEGFVDSIMEHGILEPVLIRKNGDLFEVLDGRQRVRAAVEVNKRLSASGSDRTVHVPVIVRKENDTDAAKIMVAANEVRQADTPMVRARKAQRLMNMGLLLPDVARQFGVSVSGLQELLKVLDASDEVQQMVEEGAVPVTAASAVASLPREEQKKAMEEIRAQGLSVTRQTVKDKVKAKQESKRTGAPERETHQVPRKRILAQVVDAYAQDDRQIAQSLYAMMTWMMTGQGAKKVPGPKPHQTLAEYLKELNKAEG